jgi:hypothetical protein
MPMMTATTMPTIVLRVLPHFGQRDALELISLPHSLHLISAIYRPLISGCHGFGNKSGQ